jgi:glyoxylase-like metal-dependent hydrolase (beta-lactamase superfamily II)
MAVKRVIEGVHVVPMGMANALLIEGDDGLTLIDAGYPSKEAAVFGAIRGLGRSPDQLKHLIFTHGHPDHIGSAAAIVRETPMAESGGPFRPMRGAPGLRQRFRLLPGFRFGRLRRGRSVHAAAASPVCARSASLNSRREYLTPPLFVLALRENFLIRVT